MGDGRNRGYDDAVAELFVGLGVTDRDEEIIVKSHEPGTFSRGEATGVLALLRDEDFGAVFVVASR